MGHKFVPPLDEGKQQEAVISQLLVEKNLLTGTGNSSPLIVALSGDGSDRIFYRIQLDNDSSVIAVFPSPTLNKGYEEQEAAFRIGTHLHERGVPVPRIFGYDKRYGLLLFEDLGDRNLHRIVRSSFSFAEVEPLYRLAVDRLVCFQLAGSRDFDTSFCWDTCYYDRQVMLERESGYFKDSFCQDYMGRRIDDIRLSREFEKLADRAAQQPAIYLLHRDFQSRNLLVHNGQVGIIDYQGARLGPLAYDLASLLIDPYASLPEEDQQNILSYYMETVSNKISLDRDHFLEGYYCLALQRNLQILGAFAFLSKMRGKIFFKEFILPALHSLRALLHRGPHGGEYPVMTELVEELAEQLS